MADLYLHNRKLESVFELLGSNENDITYSIGWALATCPDFLCRVVRHLFPNAPREKVAEIKLQTHQRGAGITDIEIIGSQIHAIIEAKRGWNLPARQQMLKYAKRLRHSGRVYCVLAAMAECPHGYAEPFLKRKSSEYPVRYLNWNDVHQMAKRSKGSHAEKRLLAQLQTYIGRIVNMQNQESNIVFVVSLAAGRPGWSKLSWRQIVNEKRQYFHKCGVNGWPKEPPNYLGFRYDGRLQSIHHVEDWKLVDEMHSHIPEIKAGKWSPPLYCLYTLGRAIEPLQIVKSGPIHNRRIKAMLDLLLTCKTISEAARKTSKRLSEAEL